MRHFNRILILLCSLSYLLNARVAEASSLDPTLKGLNIQKRIPTVGPRGKIIVDISQVLETETNEGAEAGAKKDPPDRFLKAFSFAVGAYLNFYLTPAIFINPPSGGDAVAAIKNRLELDVMAAIGIANWFQLDFVMPLILFQNTDYTSEGGHLSPTNFGDFSLVGKIPLIHRASYQSGFGLALALRVDFPTGNVDNFTSDGALTYNPTVIVDYQFGFGGSISLQTGVYVRPGVTSGETPLSTTFTGALGAEMPIIRRWGLTALGGVYMNTIMDASALTDIKRWALEGMFGLRWYSGHGVTYTIGLNFGSNCGISIPELNFFIAVVWTPKKFKEYGAIRDFKDPPPSPEDTDKDGVLDVDDKCPLVKGKKEWRGCPTPAYLEGNRIFTLLPISFGLDSFILLKAAMEVLDAVAQILKEHPEILLVEVGGHADPRGGEAINAPLTQKRAEAVVAYLVNLRGIAPSRLKAVGYGISQPADADEPGLETYARDRRVAFRILQRAEKDAVVPATPPPQGPAPVPPPPAPTLEPAATTSTSPLRPKPPSAPIQARLNQLKKLLTDGIITQEEYGTRRNEILKGI